MLFFFSFFANPEHGILVSSFYDDSRDTTLPAVLDLLHELDKHEDVRPVLDAKFRLRQALDDISRGRPFVGRQQQIDEQQEEESQPGIAVATWKQVISYLTTNPFRIRASLNTHNGGDTYILFTLEKIQRMTGGLARTMLRTGSNHARLRN